MPSSSRYAPYEPMVGAWLIAICVMVIAMILVGGATRLTDSGLSITEWNVLTGALPPLSPHDWADAFAKYRETPQYRLLNEGMSLSEFEIIYWWEWSHRFLGRAVGVVFAIPFLLFLLAGRLRGRVWVCLLLLTLGGLQGAVGWWMVQSGLTGQAVVVSPIRLAIHLGLAFIILAIAWRVALGAFTWPRQAGVIGLPTPFAWAFVALLYVQILAGALMAGSGAALAYADWPRIGGEWLPAGYARLQPAWLNLFENHAAIQFNHRTLGYVVAALALFIGLGALGRGQGPAKAMALLTLLAAAAQAALGIYTLTAGSPLALSLAHQGGAVIVWLAAHTMLRANAMR